MVSSPAFAGSWWWKVTRVRRPARRRTVGPGKLPPKVQSLVVEDRRDRQSVAEGDRRERRWRLGGDRHEAAAPAPQGQEDGERAAAKSAEEGPAPEAVCVFGLSGR